MSAGRARSKQGTSSADAVKVHVRKILRAEDAYNAALAAKIRDLEAAGHQIVNGGQVGSYDEDGNCAWEITDWRTDTIIWEETGTLDSYDAAAITLDAAGKWWHIDQIEVDLTETTPTPGVPASLAEVLDTWALDVEHTEDVAAFIGWSVDRVNTCLAPAKNR